MYQCLVFVTRYLRDYIWNVVSPMHTQCEWKLKGKADTIDVYSNFDIGTHPCVQTLNQVQ